MAQSHDIPRHVEYIQQALSQDKKPIGFFIGAGCPLSVRINQREEEGKQVSDPLILDVVGLTGIISDILSSKDTKKPSHFDVLLGMMKEDGITNPNVEDILTQVRALASVAGKGNVRGFIAKDLTDLDTAICKIIAEQVGKELPNESSPYHNLAIWTRTIARDKPIHIFTTNYDLLIEQAFEETSAPYFDGFIGARNAFFDLGAVENEHLLHPRWTRLWKIHGSINWRLDKKNNVTRNDALKAGQSYLIYPSHLKYDQSRKMPYLAMLDRLKEFLLTPSSILFISGYSFGDEHINDVLCRGLSSNPTAMVYAFIFGSLDDPKYKRAKDCALGTPNLSMAAFDKAIIGRTEAPWTIKNDALLTTLPDGVIHSFNISGTASDERKHELRLGDFLQFATLLRELSFSELNDEKNAL